MSTDILQYNALLSNFFCMGTAENRSLRFFAAMDMKDQVLGNIFGGIFSDSSHRIFHRIHIVRKSCSQLPARSGIFCLFVEAVYSPCGLKFVYSTINLFFSGDDC